MSEEGFSIRLDKRSKAALQNLVKSLSKEEIYRQILTLFRKQAQFAAGHIITKYLCGQPLHRRTGALAQSVMGVGTTINRIPAIRVGIFRGPALVYAGTQEYGATIKPKTAKALTVPARGGRAVTGAGVHKFKDVSRYSGELVFIPFQRSSKAIGKLVDSRDIRPGATMREMKAAYLLLKQVKIPARPFLRPGMDDRLPIIAKELGNLFEEMMRSK